jgi:hypothetical protein
MKSSISNLHRFHEIEQYLFVNMYQKCLRLALPRIGNEQEKSSIYSLFHITLNCTYISYMNIYILLYI